MKIVEYTGNGQKKALLLSEDSKFVDICSYDLTKRFCSVKKVRGIEEMLEEIKRKTKYDLYLVEGHITHAQKVYDLIKERVEKEGAKFLFLSYSQEDIKKALQKGWVAIDNRDFSWIIDRFLERP